jgi:hypothetical protein
MASYSEEDADESAYWMKLLIESGLVSEAWLSELLQKNRRDHRNHGNID